jgi:flagellar biosynthesis/type III secretory pathway M-ring protein FliF/YscJ
MAAKLKSWLASAKWVVYLVIALAVGFLFLMVAPFFKTRKRDENGNVEEDPLPTLPQAVQERLDQVHEEAATARAEAGAKSEEQRKELAEIRKIEDGRERRRRLADHLRRL